MTAQSQLEAYLDSFRRRLQALIVARGAALLAAAALVITLVAVYFGIRRAFDHLHQADLDLKGKRGIPPDAVMEVLVVRLAGLGRGSERPRRR